MTPYAELQVTTNFSFLRGASHAEELARVALALGIRAIGVTDRNSVAGVVRAHLAARETGLRVIVGCRLDLTDAPSLLVWPEDRRGWAELCRLLTVGKRRAPKGECHLAFDDVAAHLDRCQIALVPPETALDDADLRATAAALARARGRWGPRLSLVASHLYRGDDARRLHRLAGLAARTGVPLLATNDVHMHSPDRRPLADVLACIREHRTVHTAGYLLAANAERHLKAPDEMARLFRRHPDALARAVAVADACTFSLDELTYEYPEEVTGEGESAQETLERLTWAGARDRYGADVPARIRTLLRHELDLIGRLGYAPYFLTVEDVVRHARSLGILCQGRGSAANSAVCYVLGITAVDPARADLLFERFVSDARNEPPDIDVDFEHERREEVIQYIYGKYGRERAGLTATVIRYRARGAIREVGKAMGLTDDVVGRLSGSIWGWGTEAIDETRAAEQGLDPRDPTLARVLDLARALIGFPRHLSQHVGGFVITRGRLDELCPVLNAAMAERTTIEWDKDDIDALGILKVDVLALGMLTCVRKGFDLLARHHGLDLTLASVPAEDRAVYDMLCKADSLGVFQVESRAQMTMLPRLKPRNFYDLVIQVAIVRPGPIQGDMVHPYLRRREGRERVSFPSDALAGVLGKTLGVPLFQEQAMKIAIVAAGFTPADADRLRRAMATFRKSGIIHEFREKLVEGMARNGYDRDFAERCFRQIEGFGTYGFPESHAASFALLVYVSSWIKCHHPDVFAAALLNSQPMGFYAPAQIVRDAVEHGVVVRPPDVNASDWDCTLEASAGDDAHLAGLARIVEDDAVAGHDGDVQVPGGCDQHAVERIAMVEMRQAAGVFGDLQRRVRDPESVEVPESVDPLHDRHAEDDPFSIGKDGDLVDADGREPQVTVPSGLFDQPGDGAVRQGALIEPDHGVRVEQHRRSRQVGRQRIEDVLGIHRGIEKLVPFRDPDRSADLPPIDRLERPALSDDLGHDRAVAGDEDAQDPADLDLPQVFGRPGGEPLDVDRDLRGRDHVARQKIVHRSGPPRGCTTLARSDPGANRPRRHPVRLGLRQVKGLAEDAGRRIAAARPPGGYRDPQDLRRRAGLTARDLRTLAEADAFRSMGLDRRQALWAVTALADDELPLFAGHDPVSDPVAPLPEMALGEHVVEDYARLRLSLKAHPMALLRDAVAAAGEGGAAKSAFPPTPARHPRHMPTGLLPGGAPAGVPQGRPVRLVRAADLAHLPHGRRVSVAGLVLVRQRPGSAKGVVFITLEDETGVANLVVLPPAFEAFRKEILAARLLLCHGRVERQDLVVHVRVDRLVDVSGHLRALMDEPGMLAGMEGAIARADEVRRPTPDQRDVAAAKRRFPDGRNFR